MHTANVWESLRWKIAALFLHCISVPAFSSQLHHVQALDKIGCFALQVQQCAYTSACNIDNAITYFQHITAVLSLSHVRTHSHATTLLRNICQGTGTDRCMWVITGQCTLNCKLVMTVYTYQKGRTFEEIIMATSQVFANVSRLSTARQY